MTVTIIILKIIKKSGTAYRFTRGLILSKLSIQITSRKLNRKYNALNWKEKLRFFRLYARIFREEKKEIESCNWELNFADKIIKLPLRNENSWLDWDLIVSILGHDPEVKMTYQNLIETGKIKLFFDIGANYGTHSLLFLANGIRAISFEPNFQLKKDFDFYCQLNAYKGEVENVAVGNYCGLVNLSFQEDESWNGVISEKEIEANESNKLINLQVPLISIDSYVSEKNVLPDIMKIDTEGNELNVLNGARQTIIKAQPVILFETNHVNERNGLWDFFQSINYSIQELPYNPRDPINPIVQQYFSTCGSNNYIGIPKA